MICGCTHNSIAIKERDEAQTYQQLESALKKLVRIDGDVLYWVKEWVKEKHEEDIFLFDAPFEADAQMVMLEREGLVDAILSCDSDVWFLGGTNIIKGYRSRKKGPYSAIFQGKTDYDILTNLTLEQKSLAAAFAGNDYINHLCGFKIGKKAGQPRTGKALKAVLTYSDMNVEDRGAYLCRLENDNAWSGRGQTAPATGFAGELLRTFRANYYYPVHKI